MNSYYLSESSQRKTTGSQNLLKVIFSSLLALVVFSLAVIPQISAYTGSQDGPQGQNAEAFLNVVCVNQIGWGMDSPKPWKRMFSSPPNSDKPGRAWTINEAFGGSFKIVNYEGEQAAESKQWIMDKENRDEKLSVYGNYTEVKGKLEDARTVQSCLNSVVTTGLPNISFAITDAFLSVTNSIVGYTFDSGFICDPSSTSKSNCIDLVKIIGGSGSKNNTGIIGSLTDNIYIPLATIAFLIVGIHTVITAIRGKEFRKALFGALWAVIMFLLGLVVLLNPKLAAQAPMVASNTAASCIMGAVGGDNCLTNKPQEIPKSLEGTSEAICSSTANGLKPNEKVSMNINSMNCSIWKAFYLQPWAQAQFSVPLDQLDVKKSGTRANLAVKKSGINPDTFCVSLKSSDSFNAQKTTLNLNGSSNKVCNLAVYQAYLATNATTGTDNRNGTGPDDRWYNLIVAVANDPGMWNAWSGTSSSGDFRMGYALLSGATSMMGSVILIITGFFALMYLIGGTLLMAFAPLFLLFGIHPGRGKALMFGWLEQVVSAVMKYIGSAFFIIISIAFYSGILANVQNIGVAFIFCLVMTGALFLYRKEIVNLIGKVNFQGERMSSALIDKARSGGKRVKKTAVSMAGSAVGSAAGAEKGARIENAISGARDGLSRDLKRGGGFVGNVARQVDRNSIDLHNDLKNDTKLANSDKANASAEVEQAESNIIDLERVIAEDISTKDTLANDYEKEKADYKTFVNAFDSVLDEMKAKGQSTDEYFKYKEKEQEMREVLLDIQIATSLGDIQEVKSLRQKRDSINEERNVLRQNIAPQDFDRSERRFHARTTSELKKSGIHSYGNTEFNKLASLLKRNIDIDNSLEKNVDRLSSAETEYKDAYAKKVQADARYESLHKSVNDWKPGDVITETKAKQIRVEADNKGKSIIEAINNPKINNRGEHIDSKGDPVSETVVKDYSKFTDDVSDLTQRHKVIPKTDYSITKSRKDRDS